jgi:hypothetical protein
VGKVAGVKIENHDEMLAGGAEGPRERKMQSGERRPQWTALAHTRDYGIAPGISRFRLAGKRPGRRNGEGRELFAAFACAAAGKGVTLAASTFGDVNSLS